MEEILKMSYWRFISILESAKKEYALQSGKPTVQNKLYQSQKSMIKATKDLYNNVRK